MYACGGWMNPAWHDDISKYTHDSDIVKEALDDIFFQDAGC